MPLIAQEYIYFIQVKKKKKVANIGYPSSTKVADVRSENG